MSLTLLQPKAGQGMNTAFHDALNIAWKIHLVESGFAERSLLETYESERKLVAEDLLNFDSQYAKLFSQRQPTTQDLTSLDNHTNQDDEDENDFVKTFKSAREFTCGYGVAYPPNALNWGDNHPAKSPLFNVKGTKLVPGRHFPPSTVSRLDDSNVVHLEHEVPVNGSFRIYLFAGNPEKSNKAIRDFSAALQSEKSFYSKFSDVKNASYFERHNPHSSFFTLLVIFAANKNKLAIANLPQLLQAYSAHIYADDQPDIRVPNAKASAHEKLGFDPEEGGVVVVRPDGHVACTLQLVEGSGTVDALNEYFGAFTTKSVGRGYPQTRL